MSQHHTKNTLEVTAFCPKCKQQTQHRVDGGRKGPCIDPDHGNPLRTIPGFAQFTVRWLNLEHRRLEKTHFERYEDALRFFTQKGGDIASLWKDEDLIR